MKTRNIFASAIAVLALAVSCQKEQPIYLDEVQVSSSYVAIPVGTAEQVEAKETMSQKITVTAKDAWEILDWKTYDKDDKTKVTAGGWLTVSPMNGQAGETVVTFSSTATSSNNVAEVKIKCGDQVQLLNVIQGIATVSNASCAEIMAGPDSKTYRVSGKVTKISETATYGNWYINDGTVSGDGVYIYGTKYEGKTKQAALIKLGIEVGDEVTVEGPKTTYNGTVELVDVDVIKVVKSLCKVVNPEVLADVPAEGATVAVDVISKTSNLQIVPSVDWALISSMGLKKAAAKGDSDTTVVNIRILPNEEDVRLGTIDFTSGTSTITVEVSQKSGLAAYPLPYEETFTSASGLGAWEINNVDVAAAKNGTVWTSAGSYGAKATAGQKGNSTSELVSPLIDLGKASAAVLSFEHCHKYAGDVYEEFTVWATGNNGESWEQLLIPHYGTNVDYNYVNSGSISLNAYAGKQIKVKFVYKSNDNFYGTWEIKNVKITEGNGELGSIAEIASLGWSKDKTDNFEATLTDAVVTYVNGNNVFIEDATGGLLLYKKDHGLTAGKKINGKVSGVITFYGGFAEATDLNVTAATVADGTVTPTVITVDKLLAGFNRYISCCVKLEGVTNETALVNGGNRNSNLTQGTSKIAMYAKVKTIDLAAGVTGDLVCFPCLNNSVANKQVGIWDAAQFTVK